MRPRTLDEVVGQSHLVGPSAAFRRLVESGRPLSMILHGPPGTGKTTLARLVASSSEAEFVALSATSAGVKDVREVLAGARSRLGESGARTVLFIDEIHRFSKNQQDALLPGVEDGTVILVGATTENPFFEVNGPLMSRTSLFRLEALPISDVLEALTRALGDTERGLGDLGMSLRPEASRVLADRSAGDLRLGLNALEIAALLAKGGGSDEITLEDVEEALQQRVARYDRAGDRHYDVISAFIKSLRGSDADAALYWLHTMLEAGEDPEFIARRMVIFASEDIGLADPTALPIAIAATNALSFVGLPEASYGLSHATIHLAKAPKSNAVARAMRRAQDTVRATPTAEVPPHLRSPTSVGGRGAGGADSYRYPPDDPTDQTYLPEGLEGVRLYTEDDLQQGD